MLANRLDNLMILQHSKHIFILFLSGELEEVRQHFSFRMRLKS